MTKPVYRALCEAVELPPGLSVMAEVVTRPDDAPPSPRFAHFHGLCEIVWFRDVAGDFITEGWQCPVSAGNAVFVPSMHRHDYHLDAGAKEWVLVQFDPHLMSGFFELNGTSRFGSSVCVVPDDEQTKRLEVMLSWLVDICRPREPDPVAIRLVELVLKILSECQHVGAERELSDYEKLDKLRPAMDLIHSDPGADISLEAAASVCSLSPAYFSKRFKDLVGTNFNVYLRSSRLHLGAKRLLTTSDSVASIAYSLGFASAAHFSSVFSERYGYSPRAYRKNMRDRWG